MERQKEGIKTTVSFQNGENNKNHYKVADLPNAMKITENFDKPGSCDASMMHGVRLKRQNRNYIDNYENESSLKREVALIQSKFQLIVQNSRRKEEKRKQMFELILKKIGRHNDVKKPDLSAKTTLSKKIQNSQCRISPSSKRKRSQDYYEIDKKCFSQFQKMANMYQCIIGQQNKQSIKIGVQQIMAKIERKNASEKVKKVHQNIQISQQEFPLTDLEKQFFESWKDEDNVKFCDICTSEFNQCKQQSTQSLNFKIRKPMRKSATKPLQNFSEQKNSSYNQRPFKQIQNIYEEVVSGGSKLEAYFKTVGQTFNFDRKQSSLQKQMTIYSQTVVTSPKKNSPQKTEVPILFMKTLSSFKRNQENHFSSTQRAFPNAKNRIFGFREHKKSNSSVKKNKNNVTEQNARIENIFGNHHLKICEKCEEIENRRKDLRESNKIAKGKLKFRRTQLNFTPHFKKIARYF